jgi:hypothetical protein
MASASFAARDPLFVGFDLFFVAPREFNRCAGVVVGFADEALEVAFVAPVNKL